MNGLPGMSTVPGLAMAALSSFALNFPPPALAGPMPPYASSGFFGGSTTAVPAMPAFPQGGPPQMDLVQSHTYEQHQPPIPALAMCGVQPLPVHAGYDQLQQHSTAPGQPGQPLNQQQQPALLPAYIRSASPADWPRKQHCSRMPRIGTKCWSSASRALWEHVAR